MVKTGLQFCYLNHTNSSAADIISSYSCYVISTIHNLEEYLKGLTISRKVACSGNAKIRSIYQEMCRSGRILA
jgi:hypothetical protein